MREDPILRFDRFNIAGRLTSPRAPLVILTLGVAMIATARDAVALWIGFVVVATMVASLLLSLGVLLELRCVQSRRADYRSGDRLRVQAAAMAERDLGMAPAQLRTLALAGVGDFTGARAALAVGATGNVEEEELSLCARIVILAFEGKPSSALKLCKQLIALPVIASRADLTRRSARREGIVALARAVSGAADERDYLALSRAPTFEPSLYWACRYGAAVACCVKGESELAHRLVQEAPHWPKESVFRRIHSRIVFEQRGRASRLAC